MFLSRYTYFADTVYILCPEKIYFKWHRSISSPQKGFSSVTMPKFTSQILLLFSKVLHILEKLLLKNFTGLKVVS
ncbi:hypothetical protein FQN59_07660 [Parabacteroides distasonis]|nr:hypothetical protein FQN59_07660 [Parabacteroides distasonis]